MKPEKNKHDHSLTKFLKVATFGIFLLLPFWSIAAATAYSTFNANASNQVENRYTETPTELIHGETYHFKNTERLQEGDYTIKFLDYSNVETESTKTQSTLDRKQLAISDGYYYASFGYDLYNYFIGEFDFVYDTAMGDTTSFLDYLTHERIETNIIDQRNSFYYAISQVEEQPLFSWTKQTATYNTLKLVMSGFDNPNNFIPVCITYMFMVTCVYLIIDIVIEMTTWITHMITGNKN